ncbi:MAG: cupin domain-containing protein [Bacteroidales bacterium]|nr:cupin domain-containing protein [Bacteroidales bacterium]
MYRPDKCLNQGFYIIFFLLYTISVIIINNKEWIKGKSYRKRILLDNFNESINLIEDVIVQANGVVPLHAHDFTDEIFYIVKNSAIMIVEDRKFKVSAGDMICVNKKEEHGFENKGDLELKMFVMKINFQKGDSYLK